MHDMPDAIEVASGGDDVAAWITDSGVAEIQAYTTNPEDLRRIAAWAENVAAWLEARQPD